MLSNSTFHEHHAKSHFHNNACQSNASSSACRASEDHLVSSFPNDSIIDLQPSRPAPEPPKKKFGYYARRLSGHFLSLIHGSGNSTRSPPFHLQNQKSNGQSEVWHSSDDSGSPKRLNRSRSSKEDMYRRRSLHGLPSLSRRNSKKSSTLSRSISLHLRSESAPISLPIHLYKSYSYNHSPSSLPTVLNSQALSSPPVPTTPDEVSTNRLSSSTSSMNCRNLVPDNFNISIRPNTTNYRSSIQENSNGNRDSISPSAYDAPLLHNVDTQSIDGFVSVASHFSSASTAESLDDGHSATTIQQGDVSSYPLSRSVSTPVPMSPISISPAKPSPQSPKLSQSAVGHPSSSIPAAAMHKVSYSDDLMRFVAREKYYLQIVDCLCTQKDPLFFYTDFTKICQQDTVGTYVARQTLDKEVVVIKRFDISAVTHRRLLLEELQRLSGLSHKNLIRYNESFWYLNNIWSVFEYKDPSTKLSALIPKYFFSELNIASICYEISSGLAFLHNSGIAHHNLTTECIYLTKSSCLKIGNYAFSSPYIERQTNRGAVSHVPDWLIEKNYKEGFMKDVKSLGLVALEIFQGQPNFFRKSIQSIQLTPNANVLVNRVRGLISQEFKEFLLQTLQAETLQGPNINMLLETSSFLEKRQTLNFEICLNNLNLRERKASRYSYL
ncbi:Protein kinase domain-containing protein ppk2 [Schizosaccharomyces pombe]|uniref:Protein kinase domain-containing protein ppk2 n=1 Tax=Schizosaccharomyces pombe (strain 972 / ATCC 24843) TaxID=284812 RepID=PPK2_SCHPO|nr:putative serine/threonine protein kinase Ppk2 [Schizosaccharomyces pombe]Q10447.2 RecName: Full=Protein kinase domain-containing protein ppk2 [Schizosaccharomyces pombe 972h-]CAA94704.2 serine/threonine protein kinase Ppk2 (predicted) [Schizosaccharomyces pombe]|eukprot:NP_594646.1 putative serine/threonine protein kinase Ppk2 [Schizosaccharomyces pombe]